MANIKCPVCGYEAHGNEELLQHAKQMTDDPHKEALKKGIGAKGGEAMGEVKEKASDAASGIKDKL